jgi:hypothetical protein
MLLCKTGLRQIISIFTQEGALFFYAIDETLPISIKKAEIKEEISGKVKSSSSSNSDCRPNN